MKFLNLFLVILFFSCSDVSEINFDDLSIADENLWLMDVLQTDDGAILVSGGELWNSGVIYQLDGNTHSTVLDTSKTILHIEENNNEIIAVGMDAYFFRRKANNQQWDFKKLPNCSIDKILKDVSIKNNRIVAVGGHAYNSGVIYTLNQNLEVIQTLELENEISAVTYVDNNRWIAVGFGIVLLSEDNGTSWVITEQEGDFFKDIQFVSESTGYILGQSGTILKTTNAGFNWEEIRSASTFGSVSGFNKFEFLDKNNVVIVANNGQIHHSTDAGNSWTKYQLNGAPDLLGLDFSDQSEVYVSGKKGFLARFSFE